MEQKLENLSPEDRQQVESLAQMTGKPIDKLLAELVHDGLVRRKENGAAETEPEPNGQEAAWQEFLAAGAAWAEKLPAGHVVDDSRESIYSDRGE